MLKPQVIHAIASNIPLILLVIASVFSLLALFIKRSAFALILCLLVLLATAGLYFAIRTGEAMTLSSTNEMVQKLLDEHEHLAYRSLIFALITSGFSLMTWLTSFFRANKLYRVIALLHIALVITTTILVMRVVKTGTELVYEHGVGVQPPKEPTKSSYAEE